MTTAEAAQHRHDLEKRCLFECRFDELPALPHSGKPRRLAGGFEMEAHGTVLRAVAQHLADHRSVGEAEYVVEVALRILGIAPCMRPAEHRDGAFGAEHVAQGVGELCRLCERPDEHQVDVVGQLVQQVLVPGVTHEGDFMTLFLAPHAEHLGHDACQIPVHDT
jgi:hypothetical protein